MARSSEIIAIFSVLSMILAASPATAFPIDTGIITEELDQLPSDLADDTEEETGLLEVEEIEDEVEGIEVDKSIDTVEEETKETFENLEEDASDLMEGVEDKVVIDDSLSSEIDEDEDLAKDAIEEVEDETFELVEGVEEETEIVDETVDALTSTAEETVELVEEDIVGDSVDEVVDTAENVVGNLEEDVFEIVEEVGGENEIINSLTSTVEEAGESVRDIEDEVIEGSEENVEDTIENVVEEIEDADATELMDNVEVAADSVSEEVVEQVYELKAIANPILTETEIGEIIDEARDIPGLKEWSSDGWQFISMDFIGEVNDSGEKAKWEKAIVYLHLPDGAGDPPEECFQGWSATINVDLETGKARDSGFPTKESHECSSELVLDDPDAAVKPSFVIAEADDVISNDIYGNIAYLKTPSYEPEIFDHMDRYLAHLLNQKWKTFPTQYMTQVGWLITTVDGCNSCGDGYIPANSSALVFTDTSVFGNLEAHRIPVDWEPDGEMLAETMCHNDENYLISVLYDVKIFNHNTKVPCENADNDSKVSNSIFFENWNTVESSEWAQDITGDVEAHSAHELLHSSRNPAPWMSSTNEEQTCDASREPTKIINGNLASGNVATWSKLSEVPSAC